MRKKSFIKRKLCMIIGMTISMSLLVSGCGNSKAKKQEETTISKEKTQTTEEKKKVTTVTTNENATVDTSEDGKMKLTTESGEEIDLDLENVQITENEDDSKTYTTDDGQRIVISSDGSATLMKESSFESESDEIQNQEDHNTAQESNHNNNYSDNNDNIQNISSSDNSGSNTTENEYIVTKGKVYGECCPGDANHVWNETIVKEATCTEEGLKHYECSNCDRTKDEAIPMLIHDIEWVRTKEPTIEEDGLEECICRNCGQILGSTSINKLKNPGKEDASWTYDSSTQRHKTMYDGTVVTESYYETEAGACWGYFDRSAAEDMFTQIQYMQNQVYGDGDASVWDESMYDYAKARAVHYAAGGAAVYAGLFHMNSGGLPNVSDNRKYITFMHGYGCGTAIACFVIDSAGGSEDFQYGEWWRSYYGTYYSSPT